MQVLVTVQLLVSPKLTATIPDRSQSPEYRVE